MKKVVFYLTGLLLLAGSRVAQGADYEGLTIETLPPIQRVTAAALQKMDLDINERSVSQARIRTSVLLPKMTLRLIDQQDNSMERIYTGSSTPGGPLDVETERRVQTDGNDWPQEYGLYFTWDLSKLVFHPEELDSIELETRYAEVKVRAAETRYKFLDDLADWYFELKELLLTMETEKAYAASPKVQMRKEKLAFLLDSLTGNLISRSLEGSGDATAAATE